MGLIRRSFNHLDATNFKLLYKSLVRPHVEYANIICSPYLKKDINLIESMQRRATRYIPGINKLSYSERLKKLDLPTLAYRRFRGSMIESYKIAHNYYDNESINGIFNYKSSVTRGHNFSLKTKHSKSNLRRNFFTVKVTNIWNSLPAYIAEAPSVDAFKNRFDSLCRQKNLMFELNVDFSDVILLSILIKSSNF